MGAPILDWNQIKETIAVWTDLERDALHIYAALLVQVGAALVLRRRLSHWMPWAAVLAFALGNEWLDTYADDLVEQWELDASIHDLWNTMLLPTLLLLLARFAPRLFVARDTPKAEVTAEIDD
jgi:cell shape-determining protein MreD